MRVNALDHVNIQTNDLPGTVAFFAQVLDLKAGDPPPNLDRAKVQWMFDGEGRPIFHLCIPGALLGESPEAAGLGQTGPVHHVALDCSGHDAMIVRLESLGLPHRRNHVAGIDLKQIFVSDPNGVLLELNYRSGNH